MIFQHAPNESSRLVLLKSELRMPMQVSANGDKKTIEDLHACGRVGRQLRLKVRYGGYVML